jgi:hypothetical protein
MARDGITCQLDGTSRSPRIPDHPLFSTLLETRSVYSLAKAQDHPRNMTYIKQLLLALIETLWVQFSRISWVWTASPDVVQVVTPRLV